MYFTYVLVPQFSLAGILALFDTSAWSRLGSTLPHFDSEGPVSNQGLSSLLSSLALVFIQCQGRSGLTWVFILCFFVHTILIIFQIVILLFLIIFVLINTFLFNFRFFFVEIFGLGVIRRYWLLENFCFGSRLSRIFLSHRRFAARIWRTIFDCTNGLNLFHGLNL